MTNPIAKRLDRLETHLEAKVGKGLLRLGDRTYSGVVKIIVRKGEDADQIISEKRANGEIKPDTFIIVHRLISPPARPPWTEPLRPSAVPLAPRNFYG